MARSCVLFLRDAFRRIARERVGKEMTPRHSFEMCRYCGSRIETPHDRYGKPRDGGLYCSTDCADACHGFDRELENERLKKIVSFIPGKHDRAAEKAQEKTCASGRRVRVPTEDEVMRAAAEIDRFLPFVLVSIKLGLTQKHIASRCHVAQQRVSQLLRKLRQRLGQ